MQGKLQFQVKPRNQNANSLKFFNKVTSPELTLVQALQIAKDFSIRCGEKQQSSERKRQARGQANKGAR